MRRILVTLGLVLLGMAINAKADSINFSDQPAGSNAFPTSTGPHSVTEGLATFNGGTILTDETSAAVAGNVYGTVSNSIVPTTFTFLNPLTIIFSQAVSNLSLVVVNNVADTFVLRDNNGNSISAAFGLNSTNGILTLNDTNILSATIGATGSGWDFALSGGSYDAPSSPTPTPEPSTLIMLSTGLLGLVGVARRKLLV
jgi:hypothetical protein